MIEIVVAINIYYANIIYLIMMKKIVIIIVFLITEELSFSDGKWRRYSSFLMIIEINFNGGKLHRCWEFIVTGYHPVIICFNDGILVPVTINF